MAKPRVFISSTYYDLSYVRDDIERHVSSLGYEPVRHEKGAVAYSRGTPLEESAYKEIGHCEIIVCIIGGRYGTSSSTRDGSITQNELKQAIEYGIQVYIFIEQDVYTEYSTYKDNKDNGEINFHYVDNPKIYQYIDMLYSLPSVNPISPFRTSSDICGFLTNQWAGLFQRFLSDRSRVLEIDSLREMKDMVSTLKQIVSSYDEKEKGSNDVIEGIISNVHPAYEAFRRITATPYRVLFTDIDELNAWLNARSYVYISDRESYDEGSVIEWISKDEKYYLALKHEIFKENGNLKKMLPNEWREEWLQKKEIKNPNNPDTNDVPF